MKSNYSRVKSNFTYTPEEAAELLNAKTKTVLLWIKKGLPIVENSRRPYLIRGSDLKKFLKNRKKKRKITLKKGEFYCPKCRTAVTSLDKDILLEHTGRYFGEIAQVIIKGICVKCNGKINRFSSEKALEVALNLGNFRKRQEILIALVSPSLNEKKYEGKIIPDCSTKEEENCDENGQYKIL